MTAGSILFAIALFLLIAVYILRPLLIRRQPLTADQTIILAQKEQLIQQIRLLDLDFETGKIPEDVYLQERESLTVGAATLLRQLDTAEQPNIDAQIEAAVRQLNFSVDQ